MVRSEKAAWWRWPRVGVIAGSPQSLAPCAGARAGTLGSWLQRAFLSIRLPVLSLRGLTTFSYPNPVTPAAHPHVGVAKCRKPQPCGPRMRRSSLGPGH